MRVFITGATGFVGCHLRSLLQAERPVGDVFGTSYPEKPGPSDKNISYLDLRSKSDVMDAVRTVRPDWVFHLAAVSSVRQSWRIRNETVETNVLGTFNLFEAVRMHAPEARVLFISSSDVYGFVPSEAGEHEGENADVAVQAEDVGSPFKGKRENKIPPRNSDRSDDYSATSSPDTAAGTGQRVFTEEDAVHIVNPYAFTKVSGELLSGFYARVESMNVIIARSFPHTGPGQSPDFVCSDWARQVARIEKAESEPIIQVGDLNVRRDYTDVRDVVRAYVLLLQNGRRGEIYNVCSNRAVPLREILDTLLSFSVKKIAVETDPSKLRKVDIPFLAGSNRKIRAETGWEPRIPLDETLRDLLQFWREL